MSHTNVASLPETGFLRLNFILAPKGPIPVSKSTWWAGVKTGRYPKPIKLGPRITAWRVEDIRALIEHGAVEIDSSACGGASGMTALHPNRRLTKIHRNAMTAETIAKALKGYKTGNIWMARCPAHDDRVPSLSICDTDEGKVLVHCHAGCDQAAVIEGLQERGLWKDTPASDTGMTAVSVDEGVSHDC